MVVNESAATKFYLVLCAFFPPIVAPIKEQGAMPPFSVVTTEKQASQKNIVRLRHSGRGEEHDDRSTAATSTTTRLLWR
jgi:hypothetical protein